MRETYQFYSPTKIIFGADSFSHIIEETDGKRIFIVIDQFLYASEVKKKIQMIYNDFELYFFTDFKSNPDVISMNHALDELRQFKAETVVGIGGGSTLDIAKFIAAAVSEERKVEDLIKEGFKKYKKIKCICVPTTAGTGSEVTNVSVISDYEAKTKSPFVNDLIFADIAILDPLLTVTLPADMTASCGMDTFCHAIEAYWNINSNSMSDMLATEALRIIFNNLKECYLHGENEEYREAMLKASLFAGLAFAQTRTTVLHAVSFPFTSKFKMPHGLACAIMLPSFIRYYGDGNEKIESLAKQLGFGSIKEFANKTECLMDAMKMERKLKNHGIRENDFEMIASETLKEKIAFLGPKKVDKEILIELLKGVY